MAKYLEEFLRAFEGEDSGRPDGAIICAYCGGFTAHEGVCCQPNLFAAAIVELAPKLYSELADLNTRIQYPDASMQRIGFRTPSGKVV